MVVNVSLRYYIIHHDQLGFSRPNHKGKKGRKINNIHNVVNAEIIMEFNRGVFMDPMSYGFIWLLMPHRGLT